MARDPVDEMDEMIRSREAWSDATVLEELLALEPLPDEDTFYAANSSDEVWSRANLFHALAQICAKRKLRPAAPLLLERASDGDPGEMMRVLRHSLEAIFNPDWAALARVCVECMRSGRAGTRIWAADQLGVLRDPVGIEALIAALDDPQPYDRKRCTVQGNACMALDMLANAHPRLAPLVIAALRARGAKPDGADFDRTAREIEAAVGLPPT